MNDILSAAPHGSTDQMSPTRAVIQGATTTKLGRGLMNSLVRGSEMMSPYVLLDYLRDLKTLEDARRLEKVSLAFDQSPKILFTWIPKNAGSSIRDLLVSKAQLVLLRSLGEIQKLQRSNGDLPPFSEPDQLDRKIGGMPPAVVDNTRARDPCGTVIRASECFQWPAPIFSAASASINA